MSTGTDPSACIARVVIDLRVRGVDRAFDYAVPDRLDPQVEVGVPVLVPFSGRQALGYVVDLPDLSEVPSLKEVEAVLGDPLFPPHAWPIAQQIAQEYVCGLGDALRPFLPPGGTLKIIRGEDGVYRLMPPDVRAVDDRWVARVSGVSGDAIRTGASRQRSVFDAVAQGPVRMAELRAQLGDVYRAVERLEEMGLVGVVSRRRYRTPANMGSGDARPDELTRGQRKALAAIEERSGDPRPVLLDGVTGSGKTEVYLRAIEVVLQEGRGAIVLVPEISLTPQAVGRFRARFGEAVAVLHSRLSKGERFDQWDLVRTGEARVVVGPRSALFAPMRNVGLVVLDEEHEPSYKQSSTPRYHARDVAERLCRVTGATLVLGSATPSLESLEAARTGTYVRVPLPKRATGASLPDVIVVDMRREFGNGHRSMFSRALGDALAEVEARNEKAILFLNRRGFAAFLLCRECGHVPECDSCSVSLTYHEAGSRLVCHHCASVRPVPPRCPECGSPYLRLFGAGTQRVEAELRKAFPDLPVVRMDADTTAGKGGHERKLVEFEVLDHGVLLGTQMIAKGLDYPDVTLVGILSADTSLRIPDFRSGERTYQLLEQVAGRAGRSEAPGKVIVQTYWPDHPAVLAVASHAPDLFYAPEAKERYEMGYPPYGRLADLRITGSDMGTVRETADRLATAMRRAAVQGTVILGPAPCPIARIRDVHRWHVVAKGIRDADLPGLLREALAKVSVPRGVTAVPDVDPSDLL